MDEFKDKIIVGTKEMNVVKLIHFFITEKNYKPVIINGASQTEYWLENLNSDIKIIRINARHIHNNDQFEYDVRRASVILQNIKHKTFSFRLNMLNLFLDISDDVKISDVKNITNIVINEDENLTNNKELLELYPDIQNKITDKSEDFLEFIKLANEMNAKAEEEEVRVSKAFHSTKPLFSYILIAINIIIFLIVNLNPDLHDKAILLFGNHYLFIKNKEFYRLITCMFLHADIIHLFCNMYALYIVGPDVERYYGRFKFLLIYFISGIVGALFSCTFNTALSIGASGAIFGLFGALLYFSYSYRATISSLLSSGVVPVILLNLVIGFASPSIDVMAHIGGLVGGLLASYGLGLKTGHKKSERINGMIVTILLILFLLYIIIFKKGIM